MSLKYGMNFTVSDIKENLERNDVMQNGVRSWHKLFGTTSLGANAQMDSLNTSYADTINQAYQANMSKKNAMLNAGLNKNTTNVGLSMTNADLRNTYDTFIGNYGKAAGAIGKQYGQNIATIDAGLTEKATNTKKLYESVYDYASNEFSNYPDDTVNRDYLADRELNWTRTKDADGNYGKMMSWEELAHILFDADGNMTEKGQEFYDQMLNAQPYGNDYSYTDKDGNVRERRSFDQWLSEKNPKLREWMSSEDVFNYTKKGTNLGTAKTKLGMDSADELAARQEHKAQLGTPDSDPVVNEFKTSITGKDFGAANEFAKVAAVALDDKDDGKRVEERKKMNNAALKTYSGEIKNSVLDIENKIKVMLGPAELEKFKNEQRQTYDLLSKMKLDKGLQLSAAEAEFINAKYQSFVNAATKFMEGKVPIEGAQMPATRQYYEVTNAGKNQTPDKFNNVTDFARVTHNGTEYRLELANKEDVDTTGLGIEVGGIFKKGNNYYIKSSDTTAFPIKRSRGDKKDDWNALIDKLVRVFLP
jgi:hypothetical protein